MNSPSDKEIDKLASDYGAHFHPDVEHGLKKVHNRIGGTRGGATVRTISSWKWMSVAAAILLLVTAGWVLTNADQTEIFVNDGVTPLKIALPDGTTALLQSGGELSYATDFNEVDRRIELSGQAFFEVHKDKTKPFFVGGAETQLRVTGTTFNLRVTDDELEVEVSEGSVELTRNKQKLAVTANKCGLSKVGKNLVLMEAPNLNRHAWRTGKMYFQDAPLSVVLEAMRTNFGFEVSVKGNCEYPVSGSFNTEKPHDILRTIAKLGGGTLTVTTDSEKTFLLSGVCG